MCTVLAIYTPHAIYTYVNSVSTKIRFMSYFCCCRISQADCNYKNELLFFTKK